MFPQLILFPKRIEIEPLADHGINGGRREILIYGDEGLALRLTLLATDEAGRLVLSFTDPDADDAEELPTHDHGGEGRSEFPTPVVDCVPITEAIA